MDVVAIFDPATGSFRLHPLSGHIDAGYQQLEQPHTQVRLRSPSPAAAAAHPHSHDSRPQAGHPQSQNSSKATTASHTGKGARTDMETDEPRAVAPQMRDVASPPVPSPSPAPAPTPSSSGTSSSSSSGSSSSSSSSSSSCSDHDQDTAAANAGRRGGAVGIAPPSRASPAGSIPPSLAATPGLSAPPSAPAVAHDMADDMNELEREWLQSEGLHVGGHAAPAARHEHQTHAVPAHPSSSGSSSSDSSDSSSDSDSDADMDVKNGGQGGQDDVEQI
ncbi:MAG: hypothetical protein WDW36_007154 [Sanguina aurantia]